MLAVMQQTTRENRVGKRARRTRSEWVDEVGRWRRSGQSAVEYAALHGLHPGTLAVWGSKIGKAAATSTASGARFLPVRVADIGSETSEAQRSEIEVVLANGRCVRLRGDVPSEVVARVLDLAERGGRC
jgi:transposase